MNSFSISKTIPKTTKYPLHQHSHWEIMYYLSGEGYLKTKNDNISFKKGSIIIVPPNIEHGSVSETEFVNISVGGDFDKLFMFENIMVLSDNSALDGKLLANLIYKNRHKSHDYLSALCSAYTHFILQNFIYEKKINRVIGEIIEEISKNFHDSEFNVTSLLNQSGYAEDYIRNEFKKVTSLSPIDFLTKVRITHAKKLIEIYGENLSVSKIAEECGFDDPIYFSRRFKQLVGLSPSKYKQTKL